MNGDQVKRVNDKSSGPKETTQVNPNENSSTKEHEQASVTKTQCGAQGNSSLRGATGIGKNDGNVFSSPVYIENFHAKSVHLISQPADRTTGSNVPRALLLSGERDPVTEDTEADKSGTAVWEKSLGKQSLLSNPSENVNETGNVDEEYQPRGVHESITLSFKDTKQTEHRFTAKIICQYIEEIAKTKPEKLKDLLFVVINYHDAGGCDIDNLAEEMREISLTDHDRFHLNLKKVTERKHRFRAMDICRYVEEIAQTDPDKLELVLESVISAYRG